MTSWTEWLRRLRASLGRERVDREVADEFRFHLEQATARYLRWGYSAADARRRALADFGGMTAHREDAADEQRSRVLESLLDDVRFAWRALRRAPRFAAVTMLTVALAVGANAGTFSVVNAVLLNPLPLPDPGAIRFLGWDYGGGRVIHALSPFQFDFLRDALRDHAALGTSRTAEWSVGEVDTPDRVRVLAVSPGFLDVLGYPAAHGRAFTAAEHDAEAQVVLVSDRFWRTRLGRAPAAIGRPILLEGRSHVVVGVLPPAFAVPGQMTEPDVLRPLVLVTNRRDEGQNLSVIARLSAGTAEARFPAALEEASARFRAANAALLGENAGPPAPAQFVAVDFHDVYVGDFGRTLWILFGAVGFVTLIGCANVANLLIARGLVRHQELLVRTALGAPHGRLVRLLMIESLILAVAGSGIGLALSGLATKGLLAVAPSVLPRWAAVTLDWRVALFTAGFALATGAAFGLVSASGLRRRGALAVLGRAGRTAGRERGRARAALLVAQTAVAVTLLASAGLLLESFGRLRSVDPGFDPDGVVAVRLGRLPSEYRAQRLLDHEALVLARVAQLPGVEAGAAASSLPFERGLNMPVTIAGRPDASEGAMEWRFVSPGYFATLGIPIVRGRDFGPEDRAGANRVAIVNAAFAARYWPGEDPVGRRIEIGRWRGEWLNPGFEGGEEIIGVVGDVREVGLAVPARRTAYTPRAQWAGTVSTPAIVLRGATDDARRAITALIAEIDPRLPAPSFESVGRILEASLAPERFRTTLLSIFAVAALALTAVGIYGVVAAAVRQRTREIGIRVALGAPLRRVLAGVVSEGMRPVALGLALGVGGALLSRRLVSSLLFEVTTGWLAPAIAALVLLPVALGAVWLPARRAARVDPVEALRAD